MGRKFGGGAATGDNFNALVGLLLWEYLDRDPRYVEPAEESSGICPQGLDFPGESPMSIRRTITLRVGRSYMDANATTQISRLQKMGLQELRAEYEKAFGKPTKSRNSKQLLSQIARRLQDGSSTEKTGRLESRPPLMRIQIVTLLMNNFPICMPLRTPKMHDRRSLL